jgi:hypothetical protein
LTDWYAIWRDNGSRREIADGRERYECWRDNPDYQRLLALRRIQQSVDEARFRQVSHFLKIARWEATSNGAERMGRLFRLRQKPHFNLRSTTSVDAALKVRAFLHKRAVIRPVPILENRCPRGRPRRPAGRPETFAMTA